MLKDALSDLPPAFGAVPLALAAVGLYRAAATRDRALLGLVPWLLTLLYFGNQGLYGPRYLLYVFPPVALLASAGGAWLVRRARSRRARLALGAAAIAAAVAPRRRPRVPAPRRARRPQRAEGDGAVREGAHRARRPRRLHGRLGVRGVLRRPAHGLGDVSATASFVHDLKQRVRDGAHVYLGAYAFTYDRGGFFRDLVETTFVLVPVGQVVDEWYYRPELEDTSFDDVLYRLDAR